ncbi:MAG: hypothetical protein CMM47_06280 [Rhodospirillaceae bacterium]|nr:hypothetical protein [Rhodospirillaceae bacterium]
MHYDPRIIYGREDTAADMWDLWNLISIPVLTLWGVESTILSAETVERMRATGPRSEIHAIEGVGHCPGLTTQAEIERVRTFLVT